MANLSNCYNVFHLRDQYAQTPDEFKEEIYLKYRIQFDPCPVDPTFDGLSVSWKDVSYVNPPFSNSFNFLIKALIEWLKGNKSVFLLPFYPYNRLWKYIIWPLRDKKLVKLEFLRKKLTFKNYDKSYPFSLVLIVFKDVRPVCLACEFLSLLPLLRKALSKPGLSVHKRDRKDFNRLLRELSQHSQIIISDSKREKQHEVL